LLGFVLLLAELWLLQLRLSRCLLLINHDTSMEMVNDTGQGSFQAVHWALLLLDLLVQHRTATVCLL
jgi:hypothetical protein